MYTELLFSFTTPELVEALALRRAVALSRNKEYDTMAFLLPLIHPIFAKPSNGLGGDRHQKLGKAYFHSLLLSCQLRNTCTIF
jgi:hypothetical protein